ncbi:MucR family transcriptional regulator [Methylobacterium sp. DM1]|nr:MucR family transcriptional regulator [Methylobacterium sp. DM1]
MNGALSQSNLLESAAEIVASYAANNRVPVAELPSLLPAVYAKLAALSVPGAASAPAPEITQPTAAQIRKSITPDALISFIDGKPYKTLKRHLGVHGLDPHSYRDRYGLPSDYPMTAPGYSARRSALAKDLGLGRIRGEAERQAAE